MGAPPPALVVLVPPLVLVAAASAAAALSSADGRVALLAASSVYVHRWRRGRRRHHLSGDGRVPRIRVEVRCRLCFFAPASSPGLLPWLILWLCTHDTAGAVVAAGGACGSTPADGRNSNGGGVWRQGAGHPGGGGRERGGPAVPAAGHHPHHCGAVVSRAPGGWRWRQRWRGDGGGVKVAAAAADGTGDSDGTGGGGGGGGGGGDGGDGDGDASAGRLPPGVLCARPVLAGASACSGESGSALVAPAAVTPATAAAVTG